jgi:glycogen debranching enzyme
VTTSVPAAGPLGQVTVVSGTTFCLSGPSGQIRPGGEHGVYVGDTRMLHTLLLRVDGAEPLALGGNPVGPGGVRFTSCVHVGGAPDPAVLVETRRRVVPGRWTEEVRLTNHSWDPVSVEVEVEAGTDFAYVFDVKHGRTRDAVQGEAVDGRLRFGDPSGTHAVLAAEPPAAEVGAGTLRWPVTLPSQGGWSVLLTLTAAEGAADVGAGPGAAAAEAPAEGQPSTAPRLAPLVVGCSDEAFAELVAQSTADLTSLLAVDGDERYFAAGTPWYLTLFGRDSIWAAQMALPLGTEVAGATLRVLARLQGVRHDPVTEEAPGKILHELRHGSQVDRGDLPPRYYGSVDATPLFVILLEQAWRWGLPTAEVAALLPHAERALAWMRDAGAVDGDGFLAYVAVGERRLANQGWKDSSDSVFFADGVLADPPIALCEVQGYAHRAALAGADLLDAFGRPGGEGWRRWAGALRDRFRAAFWVADADGPFPAIALDGRGRPVDSVTSNMGHLLASGLLDADEAAAVAARLGSPALDSGWGLRTASATSPRFNPLSYHGGSVWPHDTAIAIDGLARVGADGTATALLRGLVAAGRHFDHRLPELFGGEQRTRGVRPLPYPAACRPQAWAAGAALLALRAVLGVEPDVPAGTLHLRPLRPFPFSHLAVDGMPLARGRLRLAVEHDELTVLEAPAALTVTVG